MIRMQSGPDQLRDWIARRGFNQTEASEYLGLKPENLSVFINAKRTPGLVNALKIERLTGIPVEAWASTQGDESDSHHTADLAKRSA